MKNLSEYTGQKLLLIQPKVFKRIHELRLEDEVLATVELMGFFESRVIINCSAGNWEIFKPSHWKSTVAVRQVGYDNPFAQFVKDKWKTNGTIELPKGEKLRLINNMWKGTYELQSLSGIKLVGFKRLVAFKEKMEISIEYQSELLDKNPWIIIMAWFISLENRRRTAAAV